MNNNVIVGTAGHVDHGKTCLIRALTGIETDRLKEEQKRGITIELGFADMQTPDGIDIGIIDVPGHEKFIKNMLSGIGGIDIVLLVVAADEGVMPQTVEHLDIMSLLNIKKGIIVITKSDAVDKEWLPLVEEDIRKAVKGTFLESAPCKYVSSMTGEGIEELRQMVFEMARSTTARNNNPKLLRIPMDRVFTIDGFGTVITGTLLEGSIKTGQDVVIYPKGLKARVRNLQVHGHMVDEAFAGQRTAVNLAGIKKEDLSKGNVLAAPDSIETSMMVDVRLNMLSDAKRFVENASRLHFYYGAEEVLCKAVLLGKEAVGPGDYCYAQLRFEEPVAVKQGDLFVVRYYSPVETVGGGVVLNANPKKHKHSDASVIESLKIRDEGDDSQLLDQSLKEESPNYIDVNSLAVQLGMDYASCEEKLLKMVESGRAVRLAKDIFVHSAYIESAKFETEKLLKPFHEKNPLIYGMLIEEFRNKLVNVLKIKNAKYADLLLPALKEQGIIKLASYVALPDFVPSYTPAQNKMKDEILNQYESAGVESPSPDDVIAGVKDKPMAKQLIAALVAEGDLVMLPDGRAISAKVLEGVKGQITDKINASGSISLAEFRDLLGTSRKYALAILDYCDLIELTVKTGDVRVLK